MVEWDRITNHLPALARFIQFPSRFVCIAYPLLIVGLGLSFEHILHHKQKWVQIAAYASLGLLTFAAADCLVITLTSNAWAGYQNNVGRSRNTKFGEETQKTSSREKKGKKKKKTTVPITQSSWTTGASRRWWTLTRPPMPMTCKPSWT